MFSRVGYITNIQNNLSNPGGSVVKNPPANVGDTRDLGSVSGSVRSPGVGNGNLLQSSGEFHAQKARWFKVHEVAES